MNTLDNNLPENILLTSDALVWLAIFRNGRDGEATVSEQTIASQIGLSERTVKRAVAELKRMGLIEVTRGNNLKQTPSDYGLPNALPADIHAA